MLHNLSSRLVRISGAALCAAVLFGASVPASANEGVYCDWTAPGVIPNGAPGTVFSWRTTFGKEYFHGAPLEDFPGNAAGYVAQKRARGFPIPGGIADAEKGANGEVLNSLGNYCGLNVGAP